LWLTCFLISQFDHFIFVVYDFATIRGELRIVKRNFIADLILMYYFVMLYNIGLCYSERACCEAPVRAVRHFIITSYRQSREALKADVATWIKEPEMERFNGNWYPQSCKNGQHLRVISIILQQHINPTPHYTSKSVRKLMWRGFNS